MANIFFKTKSFFEGKVNPYLKKCHEKDVVVTKKLEAFENCGTDAALTDFYKKKEAELRWLFTNYELSLSSWAALIIARAYHDKDADEEALKLALSFTDERGIIKVMLPSGSRDLSCKDQLVLSNYIYNNNLSKTLVLPEKFKLYVEKYFSLCKEFKEILREREMVIFPPIVTEEANDEDDEN